MPPSGGFLLRKTAPTSFRRFVYMAKKPISQKRAEREKQENQTLQRVFNVFLLGIAAECYLFVVYRNYVMGTAASLLV